MKRIVINQYGVQGVTFERSFILELPDNVDADALDNQYLAELADDAGVEWEHVGVEDSRIYVEQEFDPEVHVGELPPQEDAHLPVVKWQEA